MVKQHKYDKRAETDLSNKNNQLISDKLTKVILLFRAHSFRYLSSLIINWFVKIMPFNAKKKMCRIQTFSISDFSLKCR